MPLVVGQLPIFGAASSDPSPNDLAGLLIGPGLLVRMGGTARVSVVVSHAWRVHVLMAELGVRQLNPTWGPVEIPRQPAGDTPPPEEPRRTAAPVTDSRRPQDRPYDEDWLESGEDGLPMEQVGLPSGEDGLPSEEDGLVGRGVPPQERAAPEEVADDGGGPSPLPESADGTGTAPPEETVTPSGAEPHPAPEEFSVRTAYTGILAPLSAAWLQGEGKVPPPAFVLDGVRLRLWFVAAGTLRLNESEIILRLSPDEACWLPAKRALWQLGIDAEQVKGPAMRISGRKKIRRFGELIGDHPHAAAPWP